MTKKFHCQSKIYPTKNLVSRKVEELQEDIQGVSKNISYFYGVQYAVKIWNIIFGDTVYLLLTL